MWWGRGFRGGVSRRGRSRLLVSAGCGGGGLSVFGGSRRRMWSRCCMVDWRGRGRRRAVKGKLRRRELWLLCLR